MLCHSHATPTILLTPPLHTIQLFCQLINPFASILPLRQPGAVFAEERYAAQPHGLKPRSSTMARIKLYFVQSSRRDHKSKFLCDGKSLLSLS